MSQVKISGNPSGTGTLTIAAPNTNSDYTLNLPASAGTVPVLASVTNNGVVYVNGSGQATSGSALVFDGSNLGLGVTPSAWWSSRKVFQFGATGSVANNSGNTLLGDNYYTDSTPTNRYLTSGFASLYQQTSGTHVFYTAPSGTAGNSITFTQAMTLDASGYLSLGTTVSQQTFNLQGGQRFYNPSADGVANTTIGRISSQTRNFGSGIATNSFASIEFCTQNDAAWYRGEIRFFTNGSDGTASYGTERARITSSGHLLVGTSDGSQSSGVGSKILGTGAFYAVGTGIDCFSYYNTGASQYRFFVGANGGISNYSGNNVNLSDRREKTNFAPAGEYLRKICAIPVQTYNYVDQDLETDPGLTLGVVAQDVQAVAPELVVESNWGTEENPKMRLSIYQTDLQYALMKAIQELNAKLEAQAAEIAALKGTA